MKFNLKAKRRPHRCTVCGRVQLIETDHTGGAVQDYCGRAGGYISGPVAGCSWKPSAGPGVVFGGRTYRRFDYAADVAKARGYK